MNAEAAPPHRLADVRLGKAVVRGGNVENASRVVAGMRAGFRSCYQRGLAIDGAMRGSLGLAVEVDARGQVASVTAKLKSGRLDADVIACITYRAKHAQFDAPQGSDTAQIEFTATFAPPARSP